MFNTEEVRLLMKAAVEYDRHGTLPVDTLMSLEDVTCCDECLADMLAGASEEAL